MFINNINNINYLFTVYFHDVCALSRFPSFSWPWWHDCALYSDCVLWSTQFSCYGTSDNLTLNMLLSDLKDRNTGRENLNQTWLVSWCKLTHRRRHWELFTGALQILHCGPWKTRHIYFCDNSSKYWFIFVIFFSLLYSAKNCRIRTYYNFCLTLSLLPPYLVQFQLSNVQLYNYTAFYL